MLTGRLLVALPHLLDPNFARSVVLIIEHSPEQGAVGVILNRPSDTEVDEALPDFAEAAVPPAVVFMGGPVQPTAAICLGRMRPGAETEGWRPVVDGVGVVDLSETSEGGVELADARVFAGYSGWAPGQLEAELEEHSWFVLEASAADVLTSDPDSLWPAVLRRQGGVLSWVASFPEDPSMN
ncbi:MAG TPA: YqgE/AlgH family protein [Actinomycetota bacterium]|nr:YqgE/AlgH family protein [Actinomycetota bacterium]